MRRNLLFFIKKIKFYREVFLIEKYLDVRK